MTLTEARENIGHTVTYRPFADTIPELGVIMSVDDHWVYVQYDGTRFNPEASEPWLLTLA